MNFRCWIFGHSWKAFIGDTGYFYHCHKCGWTKASVIKLQ